MDKDEEIKAIVFMVFLVIFVVICLVPGGFAYMSPEYEERLAEHKAEQAKVEILKGECVEYYGDIDGNLKWGWRYGSDGEMYCVKWRNKENPNSFICVDKHDDYYRC